MDKIFYRALVEYAVEEVDYLIGCGFMDHGLEWQKAWYEFDLRLSEGNSGHVTIPEAEVERLASEARTSRIALELVSHIQKTRADACVAPLAALSEVIADWNAGGLDHAKPPRGPRPKSGRDFILIRVVLWLELALENRRTRNRDLRGKKTRLRSISEIIEEALPQTSIGYLSRERIEKILRKEEDIKHEEVWSLYLRSRFDDEDELVRV